jgi:hypothetical protein
LHFAATRNFRERPFIGWTASDIHADRDNRPETFSNLGKARGGSSLTPPHQNQKRCELPLKTSVAAHDSQIKLVKGAIRMSNSMKALLAGAALAGLMTGASAKLNAQTSGPNNAGIKAVSMSDDGGKDKKDKDKTEKHACKGQNSCKGKGGCKASDNGCKGKNSCKGKGGCATDGSKMPDDQPKQDQN